MLFDNREQNRKVLIYEKLGESSKNILKEFPNSLHKIRMLLELILARLVFGNRITSLRPVAMVSAWMHGFPHFERNGTYF